LEPSYSEILTYPDPRLSTKCSNTSIREAKSIISALEGALSGENGQYGGLGLSANQIGILKRVCIIRYKNAKMDLVNPIVRIPTERSSCRIEYELEGCLSLPGKEVLVPRYNQIILRADNFSGEIHLSDLWARIVQHEIDHLDAKTILDHYTVERNAPCSCGSGKKFKKCCGAKQK
jgi:peptide deformylase